MPLKLALGHGRRRPPLPTPRGRPHDRRRSRSPTAIPDSSCRCTGMTGGARGREPGREYEIQVRTRAGRVLAVPSVDGVNVITGGTATLSSGYVLDPGVRSKSTAGARAWRSRGVLFHALPDSYAARTGRPDNVGVIGVALFREQARPIPWTRRTLRRDEAAAPHPPAAEADSSAPRKSQPRHGRLVEAEGLGTGHGRASIPARSTRHWTRRAISPTRSSASTRLAQDPRRPRRHPVAGSLRPAHARSLPAGFVPDP